MTDPAKRLKRIRLTETLLIALVAVPLVGILMGGVYSLPAMKLTKERDPGLTVLLSIGLGFSIFGIGTVSPAPVSYLAIAWAFSLVLLLLARWFYGSLGHSLERFGVVHATALLIVTLLSAVVHLRGRSGHAVP